MAPPPRRKDGAVVVSFSGVWVAYAHTFFAYSAFLASLFVGIALHYKKIVKNEYYGYPQEWFPSVSATIGDWYPERNVFQILIAICSGPRFLLIFLWYLLTARRGTPMPKVIAGVGVLRTLLCGGWVYVTSTDDHGFHDIAMIGYLLCTLPWTLGIISMSPINPRAVHYRKVIAASFFGSLVPLIYFFIQHKVYKVPGAYTIYAFFEWALVLMDAAFDAVSVLDFDRFEFQVIEKGLKDDGKPIVFGDIAIDETRKRKDDVYNKLQDVDLENVGDFAAETYLAFVYWSMLTSLGVSIWYFPLWHMGISGFEAVLFVTLSPFFLGITSIRQKVATQPSYFHLASLLAIAAYLIRDPTCRLLTVGLGLAISNLVWMGQLHHAASTNSARFQRLAYVFGLGLILSSVAKMAFYTNNPIWPIMKGDNGGWNKTGIFFALIACARLYQRQVTISTSVVPTTGSKGGLLPALGLAGLIFGLHTLLCDSSTLILWVWDGYPVTGPLVIPHGAITIIVMGLGLLASGYLPQSTLQSWRTFGAASVGAAFLSLFAGWFGYFGGLVLGFYLMAITPAFLHSASSSPNPGSVFGLAFLVYDILVLAHVWVVAYAFVPGGPLLRERTDLITFIMMTCIAAGVVSLQRKSSAPKHDHHRGPNTVYTRHNNYARITVALFSILACTIAFLRFPQYNYKPYHPDAHLFTAGIWTVHFGIDNEMWASEIRMRDALKDLELDVVGLLESDLQRVIGGFRDMTQFLAEDLGMYADYGPGPNKHTWGAALLSKFPIVNSTHHLLPSPVGELAPAIHATLDIYGQMIDVIVSHNGQEEDPEDRRLQTTELARIMRESPRPFVFLGYVVTKPHEGNYHILIDDAHMNDIEPGDHDRWCEYIAFRGLHRVAYARISRGTITDTEIQAGKFVVKDYPVTKVSNERIPANQVSVAYRFPSKFYGEGVRGHRFHVFNEPYYYKEPEPDTPPENVG